MIDTKLCHNHHQGLHSRPDRCEFAPRLTGDDGNQGRHFEAFQATLIRVIIDHILVFYMFFLFVLENLDSGVTKRGQLGCYNAAACLFGAP